MPNRVIRESFSLVDLLDQGTLFERLLAVAMLRLGVDRLEIPITDIENAVVGMVILPVGSMQDTLELVLVK